MLCSPSVKLNDHLVGLTLVEPVSSFAAERKVLRSDVSRRCFRADDVPAGLSQFRTRESKTLRFLFGEYPDVCECTGCPCGVG